MTLRINGKEILPPQDYLQLDLNSTKPTQQGQFYWDDQDSTMNLNLDGEDVVLQVGQEMVMRCVNKTGVLIPNGKVVYVSGAQGNRPTISLASANVYPQGQRVIGITTEGIDNNEYGFVTVFGLVRGLNTSAFNEGDCLYLSETAGEFTAIPPTIPVPQIRIGMVTKKHISDGYICAHIDRDKVVFGDYDNGSYSYFEADGTLVNVGNATTWKDIDFPVIIRTTGANIPTLTTVQGNVTAPQWQVNDFNVCEGQEFVHEWKEGSRVYWHVHMLTNGLELVDKFVKWEVEWFWVTPNGVISANDTQSSEYTIPANTPDKTMFIVPIYNWIPVDGKIGGHLYARLRRVTSTGSAPVNDPWCTMLQLHIECDTNGSRMMITK
jgi:hypothetical protein